MSVKTIQGDSLIYHFLKDLVNAKDESSFVVPVRVIEDMIRATAIWLPSNVYRRLPTLLPHVVRDPTCRGNKAKGLPDEWNSADDRGFVRDDNSRLKGIPKALQVRAPHGGTMSGRRMGNEFVAAHVWRETLNSDVLASRDPLLNSFVPNIVWLPRQISKLFDREGGVVQRVLQSISWMIYRAEPVLEHLDEVVEETWASLPEPAGLEGPFTLDDLNWFVAGESFVSSRLEKIQSVHDGLLKIGAGAGGVPKFESTRYMPTIGTVAPEARNALVTRLERYLPDRGDFAHEGTLTTGLEGHTGSGSAPNPSGQRSRAEGPSDDG